MDERFESDKMTHARHAYSRASSLVQVPCKYELSGANDTQFHCEPLIVLIVNYSAYSISEYKLVWTAPWKNVFDEGLGCLGII